MPISAFGLIDSALVFAQAAANPLQPPVSPVASMIGNLAGLGVLICFIMVVVKTFQNGQTGMGVTLIITVLCCGLGSLIAFIYGWTKATAWRIQNLMIAYTVCLLINIGVWIYIGPQMLEFIQQMQQQQLQQMQQQQQKGAPVQAPPVQAPPK